MHKYVIMGIQGSGKGTQARLLKEKLDLVHISVGDIFRWHIQSHTKLGAEVKRIVDAGELVGDVTGPGGAPVEYAAFVAPALLGASAMNGAIYESTIPADD